MEYPRRKKKITQEVEWRYYDFLMSLVEEKKPGLSQKYILELVKRYCKDKEFSVTQPILSKDLQALSIIPVREKITIMENKEEILKEVRVYRYKKPDIMGNHHIFKNYITRKVAIFKRPQCLKVPVKEGTEQIVCKEIHNHFKDAEIICIPAYKSVCIIAPKSNKGKSKIESIKDELNYIIKLCK